MSYVALYRKYRPQTFQDVVGQDHIVELLTESIKQEKISHAYLFCGGRGTGKTTVARIVAREIGCNEEDIIEIDAASNRGIDEIRELRDAVRTAPFSSPFKVYIIDEAHMLTKEAANALLKTLEEPPSHVVFILATTDPERLPDTIVSRCQKVVFKNPTHEVLSSRLVHVAKEEGYTIEDATAQFIAVHGKGSYRDALGVLEQVLAISDKKVDHQRVLDFLGVLENVLLTDLISAISGKDQTRVVSLLRELAKKNLNALAAYDKLIEGIRDILLERIEKKVITGDPRVINSKLVLVMLEKRHLIEVSEAHAWTAFEAILLSFLEENN